MFFELSAQMGYFIEFLKLKMAGHPIHPALWAALLRLEKEGNLLGFCKIQ
jgi:hypothetical protein